MTVVILTKNEEAHIADCLASLEWCDNAIIIDSMSSDRTVDIARQLGAQVILRPFNNFADQRNAALDIVRSDWIFFVDADERVSPELADEVQNAIQNPAYAGWWIPTHNYQLGKLILHAGLFPDYHLRLFRTKNGRYDTGKIVHEKVYLGGKAGYFHNPLIHISCDNWGDFVDHQRVYAVMKAKAMFSQGLRTRPYHMVAGPLLEFYRRFISLQGYKDGMHGLILSTIFSCYVCMMYFHLWREGRGVFLIENQ